MRNFSNLSLLTATVLALTLTISSCGKSSSTPTTVPNSATIFYAHNLVFRNNSTLSTGYNAFGQLGTGELGNRSVLGTLNGLFNFTGVAQGGVHSVAFFNNSTVRTWGYNAFGQLGTGTTTYSSTPVPVKNASFSNFSNVKAVAAGAFHTLALRNSNTLWAWGKNDFGQIGVDSALTPLGYSSVPIHVTIGSSAFPNISSIAANGHHSLARVAGGRVMAWGLNSSGQIGIDPTTTGAIAYPQVVSGILSPGVSGIAAGGGFSLAVGTDGSLWAWGANGNGQLGNNTTVSNHIPQKVQGFPLSRKVIQAAAGIQHGLALLDDNTVWAWGYNFFGQLGNDSKSDSPIAVQVVAVTGATDIRAFGSSSMAMKGGAWYVWGDNSYGQLGIGTTVITYLPVKMSGY